VPPRGQARERALGVPLLRSRSSTPWSSGRHELGRVWSPFRMTAPTEIPVSASPAKGSAVAAIRMLSTFREPGAWSARSALATLVACS
jgi:hypothetical protein